MVVRLNAPGKPVQLIDLGPAQGRTHDFDAMRKTVDRQRPWVRASHPTHNVTLR